MKKYNYKIISVNGKQKYLHRHIMEKQIGRTINRGEIVHHINGDCMDNRIENLKLMTHKEHDTIHKSKLKICAFPKCKRPLDSHGYCHTHYAQYKKYGHVFEVRSYQKHTGCKIKGCDRPHQAKGYCKKHYRAYKFHYPFYL